MDKSNRLRGQFNAQEVLTTCTSRSRIARTYFKQPEAIPCLCIRPKVSTYRDCNTICLHIFRSAELTINISFHQVRSTEADLITRPLCHKGLCGKNASRQRTRQKACGEDIVGSTRHRSNNLSTLIWVCSSSLRVCSCIVRNAAMPRIFNISLKNRWSCSVKGSHWNTIRFEPA